jgi:hypothetical protein
MRLWQMTREKAVERINCRIADSHFVSSSLARWRAKVEAARAERSGMSIASRHCDRRVCAASLSGFRKAVARRGAKHAAVVLAEDHRRDGLQQRVTLPLPTYEYI